MTSSSSAVLESASSRKIDAHHLRQLALDCGADDAGLVEIGRPALDGQRNDILKFYPRTKTLLAFVCRMNREPIRNPARSVSNLEFHSTTDEVEEVARDIVTALEVQGIRAVNPPVGFPMEASEGRKKCGSSPTSPWPLLLGWA